MRMHEGQNLWILVHLMLCRITGNLMTARQLQRLFRFKWNSYEHCIRDKVVKAVQLWRWHKDNNLLFLLLNILLHSLYLLLLPFHLFILFLHSLSFSFFFSSSLYIYSTLFLFLLLEACGRNY